MREERFFTAEETVTNERIDKFLSAQMPDRSRSYIQKLIKDGLVEVNGKQVKANYKLGSEDEVKLQIPELEVPDILPEEIPLDILYEDTDLLVVNKPKGMVVHPAPGHYTGTLVNALMYHCRENLSGINGVMRPGIVHRIDMNTTGSLLICKNDHAHQILAEQLKEHSITRRYHAIVHGSLKADTGTVNASIGRHPTDRKKMSTKALNGRHAVTHYRVLERLGNYTYIECELETGRTHQIRVHMASIGHPILGDPKYGDSRWNGRYQKKYGICTQMLHAWHLTFPVMEAPLEAVSGHTYEAPVPEKFWQIIKETKWQHGIQEALEVQH